VRAPKLWEQFAIGLGSALLTRWAVERWLSWHESRTTPAETPITPEKFGPSMVGEPWWADMETPGDGTDQSMPGWWSEPILSGPEAVVDSLQDLFDQIRASQLEMKQQPWFQALRRLQERGEP
jgi:hypothetical protein